jgi:XTP/dITP diphosphohydrolase
VRIVLATGNPGKARELGALLGARVSVATAPPGFAVEETGETFFQNALLKAQAARVMTPDDVLVLADDSGLSVRTLDGRPGVHSARYAGPDASDDSNCTRLLEELGGTIDRRAAFVCVLVALAADDTMTVACGTCSGAIAEARRGTGGFGYDPVFIPEGRTHAMAELTAEQKNAISHRGRAARQLADALGIAS